jgi:hypothetical protein
MLSEESFILRPLRFSWLCGCFTKEALLCGLCDFHTDDHDEYCLHVFDTMQSDRNLPILRKDLLPPSSEFNKPSKLFALFTSAARTLHERIHRHAIWTVSLLTVEVKVCK